jgi:integrase
MRSDASTLGKPLARARKWIDDRGRLRVVGQGTVDGRRIRRYRIVPGNDGDLADEIVRQLNVRFALGDLSFLTRNAKGGQVSEPAPKTADHKFGEWAEQWLESSKPPTVSRRTHQNYSYIVRALCRRFGELQLRSVDRGAVLDLRTELGREGKSHRAVVDTLGVLRLVLRDARERELIVDSPLDRPLPKRATKAVLASRAKRVTFRPFIASELELLRDILRSPRSESEGLYFPPTEFMVLTGLRWGEAVGVCWSDVSLASGQVHIRREVVRGEDTLEEPTKTAEKWSIPIRAPLASLIERQRERSYLGRPEGRVFPGLDGRPIDYSRWRKHGWIVATQRARVSPREGDAQKACRRTFITSSLVCCRNPKQVFGEVGHTSIRMMTDVYDSFIDPARWPDAVEIARLRAIYGWAEEGAQRAPHGLPEAPIFTERKTPPS